MPADSNFPTTWTILDNYYKGFDDPKLDIDMSERVQKTDEFCAKWLTRTDYLEDPAILAEALNDYNQYLTQGGTGGKPSWYLTYGYYLDMTNSGLQAKKSLIEDIVKNNTNKIQPFALGIAKIKPELQSNFLASQDLANYKHYLEMSFAEAKFLLSDEVEKVLNIVSKSRVDNWDDMISSILSKDTIEYQYPAGNHRKITFEEAMSKLYGPDKAERDIVAGSLHTFMLKHMDMAIWELNSRMEADKAEMELRNYPRFDASRMLGDDVEPEIVDSLIDAVTSRFDISRRFYELKAKLFKQEKLAYHERSLPYGNLSSEFTYDQTVQIMDKITKQLDPEFNREFWEFVNEGRVDVYSKIGKYGGAFCSTNEGDYARSLILLNFTGNLNDVRTMAHELGHGINDELMHKNQLTLNYGNGFFRAETASTFMEDYALQEVASNLTSDTDKLALLMSIVGDSVGTVMRQTAGHNLQHKLFEAYVSTGFVSLEKTGTIMQAEMKAYMGDYVSYDQGSENWWVYWNHIREYPLYSYVSGLLIAKSMQSMHKTDPSNMALIKQWFKTGGNMSPKESFAVLGIDITSKEFWLEGLNQIDILLIEAEELAAKLGLV